MEPTKFSKLCDDKIFSWILEPIAQNKLLKAHNLSPRFKEAAEKVHNFLQEYGLWLVGIGATALVVSSPLITLTGTLLGFVGTVAKDKQRQPKAVWIQDNNDAACAAALLALSAFVLRSTPHLLVSSIALGHIISRLFIDTLDKKEEPSSPQQAPQQNQDAGPSGISADQSPVSNVENGGYNTEQTGQD